MCIFGLQLPCTESAAKLISAKSVRIAIMGDGNFVGSNRTAAKRQRMANEDYERSLVKNEMNYEHEEDNLGKQEKFAFQ